MPATSDGPGARASVDPSGELDAVVVGGGIVGVATARELASRQPDARVAVLERDGRLAGRQTGSSSGVIHAGIYYEPGSLKARLCVEGAAALYDYCARRGIGARRCGKLIIASSPRELGRLDELERRGRANGVRGLRRLAGSEIAAVEPHARGAAALHSPATGIVDFAAVTESLARDLEQAGQIVATGCEVVALEERAREVRIRHARGETSARRVVVCAGAWSDRLAVASGGPPDPRIVPFRGTYKLLAADRAGLVQALIYPVPDPDLPFLGVHLTRALDGRVAVGPTALLALSRAGGRPRLDDALATLGWSGTRRMARRWWRAGATELAHALSARVLARAAARYVPEIRARDLEPGWSGIRAQALAADGRLLDDFALSRTARTLHVRNAPSPAATSALALARLLADQVERLD